jgi:hypothetical protein
MAGADPNLSLCGRQPFGEGVITEDVKEDVGARFERSRWANILVVVDLALAPAHTYKHWKQNKNKLLFIKMLDNYNRH